MSAQGVQAVRCTLRSRHLALSGLERETHLHPARAHLSTSHTFTIHPPPTSSSSVPSSEPSSIDALTRRVTLSPRLAQKLSFPFCPLGQTLRMAG